MSVSYSVERYHADQGVKSVLVRESDRDRKWISILMMRDSSSLSVSRIPMSERRKMRAETRNGKPYPLKRAVRIFAEFGRGRPSGITKSARKFLAEARKQ